MGAAAVLAAPRARLLRCGMMVCSAQDVAWPSFLSLRVLQSCSQHSPLSLQQLLPRAEPPAACPAASAAPAAALTASAGCAAGCRTHRPCSAAWPSYGYSINARALLGCSQGSADSSPHSAQVSKCATCVMCAGFSASQACAWHGHDACDHAGNMENGWSMPV